MIPRQYNLKDTEVRSSSFCSPSQGSRFPPAYLVDDVDAVVDLLPSEDRVEVVEPVLEVIFPVTERDDDGHLNNSDNNTSFRTIYFIQRYTCKRLKQGCRDSLFLTSWLNEVSCSRKSPSLTSQRGTFQVAVLLHICA